MKISFTILSFLLVVQYSYAQKKTVTNLNDIGLGSLRSVIDSASSGDTIVFDPSILSNGVNDTLNLYSEILIDKELYLYGLDHDSAKLYISGSDSTRIFLVDVPSTLKRTFMLEDVFMINGNAQTNYGHGGAIRIIQLDTIEIKNCLFKDCHAQDNGGAIYARSYNLFDRFPKYSKFSNTKFISNSAQGSLKIGDIYYYLVGEIYIDGCTFSDRLRNGSYLRHSPSVFIKNSIIRNNGDPSSPLDCRAMLIDQIDTFYVSNTTAHNNHTSWRSPVFWIGHTGGALIENSLFYNNHSGQDAGVLYSGGFMNYKNCSFISNSANYGGVTVTEYSNFEQCLFRGNSAVIYGGVIFSTGGSAYITGRNVRFYECMLDSNFSGDSGGAVFLPAIDFTFEKSTAINNYSGGFGGVFRLAGFGDTKIKTSTIAFNESSNAGGVFSVSNLINFEITNSTFYKNRSASGGNFAYLIWTDSLKLEGNIIIGHKNDLFKYYSSSNQFINILSKGYNILEFDHSNLLSSDIPNIDSTYQVLDSLKHNGGFGKTMLPLPKSLAVNRGNPLDFSLPQNDSIIAGVRDIGAAESRDSSIVYAEAIYVCDSIFLNDEWKSQTGIYTDTNFSHLGMDSVSYVLIREVNNTVLDTQIVESCKPITWIDGNTYSTTNDTAQFILSSSTGCDSIVTLRYTRLSDSFIDTMHIFSCEPILWLDSNIYHQTTDTGFVVLSSNKNCDSIVYLDFELPDIDASIGRNGATLFALDSTVQQFQWLDCQLNYQVIPNANQQSFTVTKNGQYAVVLTKDGCVDTSTCIQVENIGIAENLDYTLSFYPNPTDGLVELHVPQFINELKISVFDSYGNIVAHFYPDIKDKIAFSLDHPAGFYFIEVLINNEHQQYYKIVKL